LYGKFVLGGLLQKLFVKREMIYRGEAALLFNPEKIWNETQRARIWKSVERSYELFLERVADSRDMDVESVDAVGGGRVWTGRQALGHGLVDELGGLDEALAKARDLAELREDSSVRLYFPEKTPIPPVAEPASIFKYVVESFKLQGERAIYLMPWVERL
jgi:protease-4